MAAFLPKTQSVDQAGFKNAYLCDGHISTITLVQEETREWNMLVWIAAIDFKKASDTVDY